MKKLILVIMFFLLFSLTGCCNHHFGPGHSISNEIEKTVMLFAETYGTGRIDEAAAITTVDFRDGAPGSLWVANVWPKLKTFEYKKIKTEILSTKIDGEKAIVITQAKISTAGGDAVQKEIYSLIRFQGKWLIDDLQVMEEDVKTIGKNI